MKGLKVFAGFVAIGAAFAVGFTWTDIRAGTKPSFQKLAPKSEAEPKLTPTQLFSSEYKTIQQLYYRPINSNQLLYAGMDGMLSALGDPHTQFFEPYMNEEFSRSTSGQTSFGGIGARLSPDPLGVKVIQVFREGPAFKAGVKSGDIITVVDGHVVAGETSDEIVGRIKGKIGSLVKLKTFRGGKDSLNFSIPRGRIIPPSADGNMIEGTNIGYLLVTAFEQPTPEQFFRTIQELERSNPQGLVIDLRDNGGGLLASAVEMLARYAEFKTVVTMKGRAERVETVRTPGGLLHEFKYPTVILVNERSASAAEIFAGVMRDYKLATLVGDHTYGKASVQNIIPLPGGTSTKMTIAKYGLPSGTEIARKVDEDGAYLSGGIKPDVEVKLSTDPNVALGDLKTDNQLQKAVEIVRQKNPKAKAQAGQASLTRESRAMSTKLA